MPGNSLYSASKLAVEGLTRSWAAALDDRGVTVNTVAPGSTQSDLLGASTNGDDVVLEAQRTPVERRVDRPDDIAQVVAWLASEIAGVFQGSVFVPVVAIRCTSGRGSFSGLPSSQERQTDQYQTCGPACGPPQQSGRTS